MDKWQINEDLKWSIPEIDDTVFLASGCEVNGAVIIQEFSSIWYNSVIRGDINSITIGKYTNIQDGSILHVENDLSCNVGNYVTVGHRAILHACIVEDGCLIGMGATVLNGAVIKKGAVVGAGALVKENTIVEENSLVVGVPSRCVKQLDVESYENNKKWAEKYVKLAQFHKQNF